MSPPTVTWSTAERVPIGVRVCQRLYWEFVPNFRGADREERSVAADKNPPSPSEEFPIDYLSDAPLGSRSAGTPPASRGTLPPPVSGDRGFAKPETSRGSDFWALVGCNAIVFGASVCIMVIELTAARLIAAYIGSSLYTWTSVIG